MCLDNRVGLGPMGLHIRIENPHPKSDIEDVARLRFITIRLRSTEQVCVFAHQGTLPLHHDSIAFRIQNFISDDVNHSSLRHGPVVGEGCGVRGAG